MKLLIAAIVIASIMGNTQCQTQTVSFKNNPTFDSLRIMPKNPVSNDDIKMVVYISNENDKREFRGIEMVRKNDTLNIIAESIEISPNPTNLYRDTIRIGKLQPNSYQVFLINKRKLIFGTPESNEISYQDTASFWFEVNK